MLTATKILLSVGLVCLFHSLLVTAARNCNCEETCADPRGCLGGDADLFSCYNPRLRTCYGNPTGYDSVKWCNYDCSDGLVLYYDCMLGSKPQCPPASNSTRSSFNPLGDIQDLAEGFNTDQYVADEYVTNAQDLPKLQRQQAYESVSAAIISVALSNSSMVFDSDEAINLGWDNKEILNKLHENVNQVNVTGLNFMSALKVAATRLHQPLQSDGIVNLKGFFDFCKSVTKAVSGAIKSAISWCSSNPLRQYACTYVGKTVACAATTFFGFPICLAAPAAKNSLPAKELPYASNDAPTIASAGKYDPICLSKCQSCLEYVVPGYPSIWCKYEDYKTMPNEGLCLQGCPTQVRKRLLAEADNLQQCFSICTI